MKQLLIFTAFALLGIGLQAQTRYDYSKLSTERLNRGVVAVRTADGKVAVSWRTLMSDVKGQPYDVYRNGVKLNAEPLTTGGTFFIDEHPIDGDATYEVRIPTKAPHSAPDGISNTIEAPSGAVGGAFLPIPLQKPEGRYTANDASVGDVDGDGQYEIFLKWEPWNAHDNAHDGYTDPVFIDCYRLDGTRLWRIDLGRNIRAGAHYTQFMVYDFDGDGRAEMMCRTADGTRDAQGRVVGDSLADYRNADGRILEGPEFLTVFDGLTGQILDTKPYIPQRGNAAAWGDNKANRSDRFLAAVGYLGKTIEAPSGAVGGASAIFCRGYYTRTVIAAWDWDGKELKNRWTFDTNEPEWRGYAGQGNHNLRIADVDGDGYDEITYGSMAVDHDGRGLYNTGMGHGDAIHLMAFDPKSRELQVWDCHENRRDGSDFRNARTGEVIFKVPSNSDVGRAMAADIDPTNPGVEMWSADSHGIRNIKGEVINAAKDADDPQHNNYLMLGGRWLPMNFGIWWDGDLLREMLDRGKVSKYNWENQTIEDIITFPGIAFNNGSKSNPCLCADILGDWREEVIARTVDSSELRIFVSPIPTDYRIDCLMEDIPYRLSTATQNVGYNQPSEPGFYLGPDESVNSFLK